MLTISAAVCYACRLHTSSALDMCTDRKMEEMAAAMKVRAAVYVFVSESA